MLDHIGLRTTQFDVLVRFYEVTLTPLGYTKLFAWEGGAGFGRNGTAALWIHSSKTKPTGIHIALSGADNGKPGLRTDYHANYYAAFVIDPDGNNLETVCYVAA
ncbi:glyoxalase [Labrys miyagiensis]|uniref:Glyoxalase n=1 Tax=Labrys miyagiensis TaxID=346912 RepID=A0ABQ6CJ03_9HYPH|nr:VOC family protein [Labrys miyagiensis]GLS18252.1 glyoxalase [Labrys miyagiensis]